MPLDNKEREELLVVMCVWYKAVCCIRGEERGTPTSLLTAT